MNMYKRIKSYISSVWYFNRDLADLQIIKKKLGKQKKTNDNTILIGCKKIKFINDRDFLDMYSENFIAQRLKFISTNKSPKIIDCGANIGITVLYWKHLFPDAEITAFEADPVTFSILEYNCKDVSGVKLVNKALWDEETTVDFSAVGNVGGHISCLSKVNNDNEIVRISTCRLSKYLESEIEFLKIDIEGAEIAVLNECKHKLKNVKFMFVEYHSFVGQEQNISVFFRIIEQAGFRFHIRNNITADQPFFDIPIINKKDLRLNIFCYRG